MVATLETTLLRLSTAVGKKPVVVAEEGPSWEAAPAIKKRKIGTAVEGSMAKECLDSPGG
jgi:hypothetical protein